MGALVVRRASGWAWGALLVATLSVGCESRPDEGALDRWLEEVREAEREAQLEHEVEDESASWTLTVLGETRQGAPLLLRNPDLEAASTVTVGARPPLTGSTHHEYRGVRISDLVARAGGPLDGVSEVTLVASDGFRATMRWEDVASTPILLATYGDGTRLRREAGGPLFAVLPLDEFPELLERYTESWWVYYVTHLLVGTPSASLRVGEQHLDAAALSALPVHEVRASVGYRVGWPSEPIRVVGPPVSELLAQAGLVLGPNDRVRVLSLAPITRGADRPTFLTAAEVASGDVVIGLAYGDDGAPIPSRLGGPLVLAFSDAIAAAHPDHDWLTFVTDLRVEAAEATP